MSLLCEEGGVLCVICICCVRLHDLSKVPSLWVSISTDPVSVDMKSQIRRPALPTFILTLGLLKILRG